MSAVVIEFTVFGPLEAARDGVAVTVGGPRQRAVLAALLLAGGRHVSMDALVDAVWGDSVPATAIKTVQKYVSQLRAQLGAPDLIVSRADGYPLPTDNVDTTGSRRSSRTPRRLPDPARVVELTTAALRLCRGEPYRDLPDLPAARTERHRLAELRMTAIESLARRGWPSAGTRAHRLAARAGGRRAAARAALGGADECAVPRRTSGRGARRVPTAAHDLVEELGAEPTPALRSLHERILRQDESELPPPGPRNAGRGRRAAVQLRGSHRGAGGARVRTGRQPPGDADRPGRVGQDPAGRAGAGPAGVPTRPASWSWPRSPRPSGSRPRSRPRSGWASSPAGTPTAARGQPRRPGSLLVLDNCEHLLDATAELVTELLRATSRLRILATSRAPLGAEGEAIVDLPPLSLPATDDPAAVAASEAVAAHAPGARGGRRFDVTAANAAAVARIARRLDGMPLALELAAGRLRVFDPQRLADLLDDRFRVLVSTVRTAPARHQTLRAAIAWSYDQLAEEQGLFRALSVFEGGFTLDAAEAVPGPTGHALLPALVDRSLVMVDRRAGRRATGCSRRSASTGGRSSTRTSLTRPAAGTSTTTSVSPRRRAAACAAGGIWSAWTGSTPSTTTSGRPCGGR